MSDFMNHVIVGGSAIAGFNFSLHPGQSDVTAF